MYLGYDLIRNDSLIKELVLNKHGDTVHIYENDIKKKYNTELGVIRAWYKLMPMSKTIVGINFDSTGKLDHKFGKLDFLTKSDSLRLSRDYPDWQEQVKVWELKEHP